MRLVFFSLRGNSPMGTPFASGVQPIFALKIASSSRSHFSRSSPVSAVSNRSVIGGAYVDKSLYCAQISDLIASIIIWYSDEVPSVKLMTSSICAGNMLHPFTFTMSSVRPTMVSIRG